MGYKVMARYYATPDNFGESFVLTSHNFEPDKNFEIGEMVYVSKEPLSGALSDGLDWIVYIIDERLLELAALNSSVAEIKKMELKKIKGRITQLTASTTDESNTAP